MTHPLDSEIVHAGWTRGELSAAYDAVKDPANWKNPIDVMVPDQNVAITVAAIEFFAGGGVYRSRVAAGVTRIRSNGYYVNIGA